MAYTVNLTDGTVFAVVQDGTINTSSSVTLVGKNYAGYGEFLDENFIHMLENFSNSTAPGAPLVGQLWYDNTNFVLNVYNGTAWKGLASSTSSSTEPEGNVLGDLWFDTLNQQLKVYNGAAYIVVGPAYSSGQGVSGAVPLSIEDTGGNPHIVTGIYANNNLVSIFNPGSDFTPVAPYSTNFPRIYKGSTVWNIGAQSGNIATPGPFTVTVGSTAVLTVSATGANISGAASVTGNITGNYYYGNGRFLTGVEVTGSSVVSTAGNVTGGNVLTSGIVSAGGNILGNNIIVSGFVSAGGNVTAPFFIGNGAGLTGITSTYGDSNVASFLASGTDNLNIITTATVRGATVSAVGNIFGTTVSAAGNVTGALVNTGGIFNTNATGVGNIGTSATTFNTVFAAAVSATGNIVGTTVRTSGIVNTGANATGNIGSSTGYFNRVFATSTSALYADLAERFEADTAMEPGTVVEIGGEKEITAVQSELSDEVFGVISTRAAYLMNGAAGEDDTHPPVAVAGRVPVRVIGTVRKGQRLVSAGNGLARAATKAEITSFNVIGRALSSKSTADPGLIEAIVTIKN